MAKSPEHNHDAERGESRTCPNCGGPVVGKRSDAVYCSTTCQNTAAQRRHRNKDVEAYRARWRRNYHLRKAKRAAEEPQPDKRCERALKAIAAVLAAYEAAAEQ